MNAPHLVTERLVVRMCAPEESNLVADFYQTNRKYLEPFGPAYTDNQTSPQYWLGRLSELRQEFEEDKSLCLFFFERDQMGECHQEISGSINFTAILRRSAQFCFLGYSLAERQQGRGFMTEALRASIEFAFTEMNLHRIMANYMPRNDRSARVLQRLGFVEEGRAAQYLYFHGVWEDHICTALINQDWKAPASKG